MAEKITAINGAVLKWARLSCGDLQLKSIDGNISKIQEWEEGYDFPTYAQLENLSIAYKKPLALFFFPQPPDIYEISANFRTMSDVGLHSLSHKIIRLLNEAIVMQMNIEELTEIPPTSDQLLHNQLRTIHNENLPEKARQLLGIPINKQLHCKTAKDMLEIWREAFCQRGIYVFKEAFHDNSISGFCIYDDKYPIIYLNNTMSFTRQIFTLFHELYHLIMQTGGVDKINDEVDSTLTIHQQKIERMCNEFAADVLIPKKTLLSSINNKTLSYANISILANMFCVSREAMILRLISLDKLSWDFYNENIADIQNEFIRPKPKSKGGNSNNNLVSYLGGHYLKLAFTAYQSNKIDIFQLASYTKTTVNNIPELENTWGWK